MPASTGMALPGLALLALLSGCGDGYSRSAPLIGPWHFDGQPVGGADHRSFKPLNDVFARDRQRGCFRGQVVAGSGGSSFEALSESDARNAHQVWRAFTRRDSREYFLVRHIVITPVAGADAPSYRLLGHGCRPATTRPTPATFVAATGQAARSDRSRGVT